MTEWEPEPRAVDLAQRVHQEVRPRATILYRSRNRGDFDDALSDLNLLLVVNSFPTREERSNAFDAADRALFCGV